MSKRQQAINILNKYQAALADKLTDLVIDQEEQLMDEAEGLDLGFTNELYELAEKLRAVTVTLQVLPAEQKPAEASFQNTNQVVVTTTLPTITISDFIRLVDANNVERAAGVLAHIFDLPVPRALQCTEHFIRKADSDEQTLGLVHQLAIELHRSLGNTLVLMNALFGLQPAEATHVVSRLKAGR